MVPPLDDKDDPGSSGLHVERGSDGIVLACPQCGRSALTDQELLWDYCLYCDEMFDDMEGDTGYTTVVPICINCGTTFSSGEHYCEICGLSRSITTVNSFLDSQEPSPRNSDWVVCCDRPAAYCQCKHAVPFHDAHDRAMTNYDHDIYARDGACDDCALLYSANCAPYIEWLGTYMLEYAEGQVDIMPELTRCQDYREDPL